MEKKRRGRQRMEEIDHDAFMKKLNECGNITRAAISFQVDPNIVKIQLLRKGFRIGRRFQIIKNENLPITGRNEKKVIGTEALVVGKKTITVAEFTDALNELGNISKASLKLGLVDSGIRSTLKSRGFELKIEYILVPSDEIQLRNKPISFV